MVNYFIKSIPLLTFKVHIVMLFSLRTKVRFGRDVTCAWSLLRVRSVLDAFLHSSDDPHSRLLVLLASVGRKAIFPNVCYGSEYGPYAPNLYPPLRCVSLTSGREYLLSEACPCPACWQTHRTMHSSCSFSSWPALCLHIASPLSPTEQGRAGKLELTGQGGRGNMPFSGSLDPPRGKGKRGRRAAGPG